MSNQLVCHTFLHYSMFIQLISLDLLGLEGFRVRPGIDEKQKWSFFENESQTHEFHTMLTCSGAQWTLATKTKPTNKRAANPLTNIFSQILNHLKLFGCISRASMPNPASELVMSTKWTNRSVGWAQLYLYSWIWNKLNGLLRFNLVLGCQLEIDNIL